MRALQLRMTHCRRCGFHVGLDSQGKPTTICECPDGVPTLEGPDPGCDWP